MTIELQRPGFRVEGTTVVPDDSIVGPDHVIVHSTESGRFLPASRAEMREFILAARLGAFDGVLEPDLPVHPSASADAPCPLDREIRPFDRGFIQGEFELYRILAIRADYMREQVAQGADPLDLLVTEHHAVIGSGMNREQLAAALVSILLRMAQPAPAESRTT